MPASCGDFGSFGSGGNGGADAFSLAAASFAAASPAALASTIAFMMASLTSALLSFRMASMLVSKLHVELLILLMIGSPPSLASTILMTSPLVSASVGFAAACGGETGPGGAPGCCPYAALTPAKHTASGRILAILRIVAPSFLCEMYRLTNRGCHVATCANSAAFKSIRARLA